ncbi:hypothetical protein SSX86_014962 [Deinandra increscens subsp. villosa]|uniref:Uncharacterized protein n=1 Tax=Deinandra increscens subsp. villosa TaxID=3103831 RepID=A0AAP0CYZ5_9ASTR
MDPATQYLLNRVQNIEDNVKFSPIYVVPDILTEDNSSPFTPRVVSIGPLHEGRTNLKLVESKKPAYLKELLLKVGSLEETLDKCVKKVRGSIQEIKRCYFGVKTYTEDEIRLEMFTPEDELVQMMVMDGCFILQFIIKLPIDGNLFSDNRLRSRNIALDLVLLENQIPFFVLQDIYDLTVKKLKETPSLTTMLKGLLDHINPFEEPLIDKHVGKDTTHYHILGLLHKFYDPNIELPRIKEIPTAHSVVELDNVGVKIRPNENLTWPMAMEFHKPTLKMPVVRIDNFFEVVLRNLIAYEQYSPVKNYVTSYAMAMRMLAATPEDIAKMGKAGVIVSHLGSNENASDMISRICKNVNLQDFYYIEPWKNVDKYYDSYWPRKLGVFKRTYIDPPWKAIAVLGAVIVFLITVVTFFRQPTSLI